MEHTTVLSIKHIITENRHIDEKMASVCLSIINHVSIAPEKRKHLTFADLYRISPKVSEEIFYDAVFYLTRKNINVLVQEFEALDPKFGYKAVPDKEEILECMKTDDFFNPFTGDDLNEEEFGKQVLTYFSVSPEFMSMPNV